MASPPDVLVPVSQDLSKDLVPPSKFPFPFEPYDIQKSFMRELYLALEGRKVGIFESPTGTVRLNACASTLCTTL